MTDKPCRCVASRMFPHRESKCSLKKAAELESSAASSFRNLVQQATATPQSPAPNNQTRSRAGTATQRPDVLPPPHREVHPSPPHRGNSSHLSSPHVEPRRKSSPEQPAYHVEHVVYDSDKDVYAADVNVNAVDNIYTLPEEEAPAETSAPSATDDLLDFAFLDQAYTVPGNTVNHGDDVDAMSLMSTHTFDVKSDCNEEIPESNQQTVDLLSPDCFETTTVEPAASATDSTTFHSLDGLPVEWEGEPAGKSTSAPTNPSAELISLEVQQPSVLHHAEIPPSLPVQLVETTSHVAHPAERSLIASTDHAEMMDLAHDVSAVAVAPNIPPAAASPSKQSEVPQHHPKVHTSTPTVMEPEIHTVAKEKETPSSPAAKASSVSPVVVAHAVSAPVPAPAAATPIVTSSATSTATPIATATAVSPPHPPQVVEPDAYCLPVPEKAYDPPCTCFTSRISPHRVSKCALKNLPIPHKEPAHRSPTRSAVDSPPPKALASAMPSVAAPVVAQATTTSAVSSSPTGVLASDVNVSKVPADSVPPTQANHPQDTPARATAASPVPPMPTTAQSASPFQLKDPVPEPEPLPDSSSDGHTDAQNLSATDLSEDELNRKCTCPTSFAFPHRVRKCALRAQKRKPSSAETVAVPAPNATSAPGSEMDDRSASASPVPDNESEQDPGNRRCNCASSIAFPHRVKKCALKQSHRQLTAATTAATNGLGLTTPKKRTFTAEQIAERKALFALQEAIRMERKKFYASRPMPTVIKSFGQMAFATMLSLLFWFVVIMIAFGTISAVLKLLVSIPARLLFRN